MKIEKREHDLSNIDEKLKPIVQILLDYEDSLSDGYMFYCGYDYESVLSHLEEIAGEIRDKLA